MGNENKTKNFDYYRILIAVFALVCALFLWVYVTDLQGEPYEATFSGVKVVFEGEATLRETRGYVITDVSNTTVSVKIEGDRRVVLSLDAADLTAVIDVSGYSRIDTYTPSYKIVYPNNIQSSSLTITSRTPELVSFYVDKVETRVYDVRGIFSGNAAKGYGAEPLEFSPNTVRVTGPKSDLDLIDCAWVEVAREDVDRTLILDSDYVLIDTDGNPVDISNLELEMQTVTVTLPIITIKEVALTIDIIDGGGATEASVAYGISPSTITLSGDSAVLDGLNSISIAKIDLALLEENSLTEQYTIVLPNDTEIISGPKEATLSLEIKGLETKKMTVTNFSSINVTNGYEAAIETEELEITIRGKASVLKEIAANNIRAVADLSEFGDTIGIVSAPVKIYIDGTTEAGAVGSYTIYVEITKTGG